MIKSQYLHNSWDKDVPVSGPGFASWCEKSTANKIEQRGADESNMLMGMCGWEKLEVFQTNQVSVVPGVFDLCNQMMMTSRDVSSREDVIGTMLWI